MITSDNIKEKMCIMKNKRFLSLLFCAVLIAAFALPSFAIGKSITENTDYVKEMTGVIGRPGYALTVRGDGSFYLGSDASSVSVVFGVKSPSAAITFEDSYYPVSTHRYSADGLDYTVSQFVFGKDGGDICVYSRVTVTNNTSKDISFPKVTGTEAASGLPKQIEPKKSATVDYKAVITNGEDDLAPSAPAESVPLSYDEALLQMREFWDGYLSGKLSVSEITKSNASAYDNYKKQLIYDSIGIHEYTAALALSHTDSANTVFSSTDDLYSAAVALSKTKDTVVAVSYLDNFKALAEAHRLIDGALPHKELSKNLDSLLALQSYAYILSVISEADDSLEADAQEAQNDASALAAAVADAINATQSRLPYDWEAATTDSTYPLILEGRDFSSAAALSQWYAKSSLFKATAAKELVTLANDACEYAAAVSDPAAALLSVFSERFDGTIIIGRGSPYSFLSENKTVTVTNFTLSDGKSAGLKITVNKNTVTFNFSGTLSSPINIEFPIFEGNIEYASTGFDSASGVVTVPEGTTTVTVRLSSSLSSIKKSNDALCGLESAIAKAYEKNVENPTSVSKSIFDAALKKAEKARTSTSDERILCTENLIDATSTLVPMIAGYTLHSASDGESVGTITKAELYQKFTVPASGTVKSILVKGEYVDGITCAVYSLRGDLYTIDELYAEIDGEETLDGISFSVDFEATGGKTYVLCVFSETGEEITLDLEASSDNTVYTTLLGETVVYRSASLVFEAYVQQADRAPLDTFYSACAEADVSKYTKESQKTLTKRMKDAKAHLCTESVTEEEYSKIYENLKNAYDGLDTYASQDKLENPPVIGIILIAVVIVLLVITLFTSLAARKRFFDE